MAERAAKQLELNKSELPNSITEVIATLTRAGFDAYIVGGGVRDTLLGLRPKDFDAVTDAKPHEIKDVFGKRCRIIGRRFQLAHVYSGRELIEVATFRGPPTSDANTNQDGMILRDNVWGDIQQDFSRRDFSINALYYQPLKGIVHDFCGALDDIDNRIIRLLGNAPVRIEEDPVRLLRALRFKAKLGFEFDEALSAQFNDGNWALLEQISPHRLYDETQKMFTGGYLVPLLPLLFESGAIDSLIIYPPSEPSALVNQVAINTDKRIAAGKSINPAFFYAALLWENYLHQLAKAKKRNMPFAEAQMHAAGKVIDRQRIKTAIPKFAEQFIRDIWILQPKLAAPRSKQIVQLSEHPRFRAGFDFLLLREQCGDAEHPLSESTNDMGDWWQTYQTLSEQEQQQAIDEFDENIRRGAYKKGQRGRGRNRQESKTQTTDNAAPNQNSTKQNKADDRAEKGRNDQTMVNDSSNIPARRRRAASQSKAGRNESSRHNVQQVEQDNNELAQLQQLSLASNKQSAGQQAKPKPLFVIEHENVVPPLQKQLSANDTSKRSKAPVRKPSSTNQNAAKQAVKADRVDSSTQPSNTSQPEVQASARPARSIARSPALVSMNNEPIPHKRRRRQPTVDSASNIEVQGNSDAKGSNSKAQPAAKYAKKTPKPAVESTDKSDTKSVKVAASKAVDSKNAAKTAAPARAKKSVKATTAKAAKAKQDTNDQMPAVKVTDNKGPVPSKRRRRQPSTESA
ncbi:MULTISPECIES: polynucleotide adenylyltransferase PcnB [unclassified Psychrobacter]|uniref:polynucleotide adenylyltransferase PcnB n=1 Tax=unclassified Psychrobacter TaxID=196806 RepID=UPI000C32D878|nr:MULTISPECIES: polynucleotide adenylyltransferase PcnB [unclassified Psychrobacter]MBA6244908.1 polynucleotide adenylyltransferase PcnB [Psychrobacter sp. Urea-trap-18]MBA6286453.1 polynucleotide adenylyltransferase PcnB [Psychrobacter sp. Urea-trap-16]MBA6318464.1 polynucleotide adenylyltransferase PcnB [Psychrobacter sp. Urea-trap-20]MBA6334685.1 polynucleotide adenylyltransferase PcnB [Psychrobacter sp. Urea-trap-19]PKG61326.1 poly(A) polymerase [Psychrobacter sp. Choline-3u-12]